MDRTLHKKEGKSMLEYPAMIYKNNRNKTYMASCIAKNMIGFGKTEEDALFNLKTSLQDLTQNEISLKPMYGLSFV